jgi:hypothetical protein
VRRKALKDQLGINGLVFQEVSLWKKEASGDGLDIVVREMDMRYPNCNSTELKKVSLAYEEGLFRSESRTRIRGVLVGGGGPHIIVGNAVTKGMHQTMLSERLSPPQKWSYLKLVGRFAALSFVALVIYVHCVMASASTSSSLPSKLYRLITSCVFVLLVFLTWKHNHFTHAQRYGEWNRCFICERCGALSLH